jgi:hypothetical protein
MTLESTLAIYLDVDNAASHLSSSHGIGIFLTSNPHFLSSAIHQLSSHSSLTYHTTLTFHYTKVAYTSDEPAPPHISGFFECFSLIKTATSTPSGSLLLSAKPHLLHFPHPSATSATFPFPTSARMTSELFLLASVSWLRTSN